MKEEEEEKGKVEPTAIGSERRLTVGIIAHALPEDVEALRNYINGSRLRIIYLKTVPYPRHLLLKEAI